MNINLKLNCSPNNLKELQRHSSAALAASRLFNDYSKARRILLGTGPEVYAEQWIRNNLVRLDREFEDLIVMYFTKILWATRDVNE